MRKLSVMWTLFVTYSNFLAVLSVLIAAVAAGHAAMTKDEVRSAIGWVGVILLSPFVGASIYAVAGINRIRRGSMTAERLAAGHKVMAPPGYDATCDDVVRFGRRFAALKTVGDKITHHALTTANTVRLLGTGDEAYAAMIEAIGGAQRSIILETYIFDRDPVGRRIADALIEATRRGIAVRVLIDAVGARYSIPSIVGYLRKAGVPTDVFNGSIIMGLRLPYANLRTHRKILIADGAVAFVGGMNIRQGFTVEFAGANMAHDTQFRIEGPVVADIFSIAAEDWCFASGERLRGDAWDIAFDAAGEPRSPVLMRALPSGPDASLEVNHKMLMGAFSVARRSIRIMSPYFLPDRELISALTTAARRGVDIDIVVPSANNLILVDRAMTAQFDQVLRSYCRVWRAQGPFDHSKLLVVDSTWAFIGSSNLDPRSLRLNFEIDLEVLDSGFAEAIETRIEAAIGNAMEVTLPQLRKRPFPTRLIDRILWLGSPYL